MDIELKKKIKQILENSVEVLWKNRNLLHLQANLAHRFKSNQTFL